MPTLLIVQEQIPILIPLFFGSRNFLETGKFFENLDGVHNSGWYPGYLENYTIFELGPSFENPSKFVRFFGQKSQKNPNIWVS